MPIITEEEYREYQKLKKSSHEVHKKQEEPLRNESSIFKTTTIGRYLIFSAVLLAILVLTVWVFWTQMQGIANQPNVGGPSTIPIPSNETVN